MNTVPERIAWAVAQLHVAPRARLIEIGCGGGHAVALLCERLPRAVITAIDRSALQVERARARNAAAVAAGRARIEPLELTDAPHALGPHSFDAALAVNVNAFWTAPGPSLASLARLLAPGGRAYLVYEPPSAARVAGLGELLRRSLGAHGFAVDDVRAEPFRPRRWLCVVARVRGEA